MKRPDVEGMDAMHDRAIAAKDDGPWLTYQVNATGLILMDRSVPYIPAVNAYVRHLEAALAAVTADRDSLMDLVDTVGESVQCATCGRRKKPIGRDAPPSWHGCDHHECDGYMDAPYPPSLWPGERMSDWMRTGNETVDGALDLIQSIRQRESDPDEYGRASMDCEE